MLSLYPLMCFRRYRLNLLCLDKKISILDKRLILVEKRLDIVDKRFDAIDKRIDKLESNINQKFDRLMTTLDRFLKRLTDIEDEFKIMKADLNRLKKIVSDKLGIDIL